MTIIQPTRSGLERREFVRQVSLALPFAAVVGAARAFSQDTEPSTNGSPAGLSGVIVRQSDPDNLEYPFANLKDFLTPNDRFYVRNHFPTPKVDAVGWRVRVEGAV